MKLNDTKLRNLKPQDKVYRLSDGGGLYIEVMPNGSMYWRMSYRFAGKQKRLAFGIYPSTTLKEARDKRENAKKLLASGKDPGMEKKLAKLELQTTYENNFEALAREWHSQKLHSWKPEHAANILKRMEAYLFPKIGFRPIKEIKATELLNGVRGLEADGKRDLAHRMLQYCSQILRYAIATGRAEYDVTVNLKGALQPVKSKNYAYLNEDELPGFLQKLELYDSVYNGNLLTKLAFKLLVLTFVRSGEIRGAKWDEIDVDKAQWKIPAERMKMKDPHIVPLCRQSIAILQQIYPITGDSFSGYIFPSQSNPRSTMSENTFLRAIKIMGYQGQTTGHGFRSTASTILNENGFRPDVIERQLAHCERNQVRAAYNHAEYLVERAEMMQWWGDKVEQLTRGGEVIEGRFNVRKS